MCTVRRVRRVEELKIVEGASPAAVASVVHQNVQQYSVLLLDGDIALSQERLTTRWIMESWLTVTIYEGGAY